MSRRSVALGFVGALALGASLLAAAPALADSTPGSLAPLGCVGVSGSANNGPSPCATELPAGLSNVYQAVVSPDGRNVYEAVLGNEIAEFSRDPSTGTLTPLDSPSDCVAAPDGGLTTEQCAQQTVSGLNGVAALAVSPDGNNVYAIGQDDNAVVSFARDPSTGVLTQLSGDAACTAETSDASSSCANQTGYGLENAYGIAVSPDGLNVYVTSYGDHAVAEFHRDPSTGALSEFACQSDSTFNQGYCTADADGLENAIDVSVSPDGQNVYVAAGSTSGNGDIAEFSRDTSVPTSSPDYGELSQLPYPHDCITAAANLDPNVQCGDSTATGLNGPEDLTLSPDGRNLYANSFDADAVLEFSRNSATGVLSQLAAPDDCISSSGASGCATTDAPSLSGPLGVAISPDGFDLYVADAGSGAVTTLARDPSSGALSPLASPDDCVTVNDSGCGTNDVPGLTGARRLTVSPDGADVYVAAQNAPAVVELTRTLPSADLAIAENGAPSAAGVGDSIEYHYTVTNSGPSDADDAIVSVQLSPATVLDWASGSQGSCAGTATVLCDLGLLRSGDSATVNVKVELPSAGTSTATASVADATDVGDPNSANNSVLSSTAVGMGDGTGLYVTQREESASANVASLTLGSFDDSLSAPLFAGAGGAGSFGIAVTPDGAHVYVTNDNGGNSISQYSVDPSTAALTPLTPATVAVSQTPGSDPEDIAVDPTGRWAYVTNPFAGSVSQLRIDPSTGALTMVNEFTSALLTFPTGVAFSPDGRSLYVSDFDAGNVVEFDVDPLTGALTPKSTPIVALPEPPGGSTPNPRRLVSAAIGGNDYLYVSDYANAQVDEFTIDPTSGELTADAGVSSGSGPTGLAVDTATSPQSLYVAAEADGVVDEYDIGPSTGALAAKASASIATGAGPDGVALAPDGQELYVGDSGDSNLNLYTIAADGTLAADPTNPQVAAGSGPSTPVLHTLPAPPVAPPSPTGGALSQLPAPNDCLTGNPFGCNTLIAPSGALNADYQTVVSPDGKNVYAAAYLGMLVEFSRDPSTGALTELGCVSDGASGCATDDAAGSNNPRSLALSPDGDYLYEVGADNELVTFSRDPSTGLLTWKDCLDAPSSADSRCSATADGLDGANGVAVSPDGTSVYVTSGDDSSIAWFTRDPSTGLVSQPSGPGNCISSDSVNNPAGCAIDDANGLSSPVTVVVSPDSNNVYVSAGGLGPGGDVAEFSRDPSGGALTQLPSPNDCLSSAASGSCGDNSAVGFGGEEDIAISPDGRSVYLNSFSNSAVIELRRDPSTGVLTQLGAPNDCITSDSSNPGGCGSVGAVALNGVQGVAVSPDGLDVYASSSGPVTSSGASNAVDEFQRNPITGALTQAPAPFECLTENGSGCSTYNVNGLGQPRRLSVSPDGLNVYAAGQQGTLVELARTPPSADLSIEQSGAATAVNLGDAITYSYTVRDLGPSDVDDPVLSVPLDGEETLTSASSSQGSCSGSATVRCDLGPLLAGGEATVTVTAAATATGTASVDASVADATDVTDPDSSNNDVTTATDISENSPTNTVPPVISGSASAGQTLTASSGTWSGSPTDFTYDWQDCSDNSGNGCTTVQTGTSDQYTLLASDEGSFVEVLVSASNGASGSASSAALGPVTGSPANMALPSIAGIASLGQTLTASPGSWSGYPTPNFTYQWQDCPDSTGNGCTTVQTGTGDQYTLLASDESSFVQVLVTASNGVGADASATSAQSAAVTGAPANATPPSIAGTASAGQTLTASAGGWSGYPAPTFTYVWQDCPDNSGDGCTTVQSGTGDQYTAAVADEGSLVQVIVTASSSAGPDATAASAFTSAVTGSPVNGSIPTIAGSASVGQTLTASPGSWSGYPAPTFSYEWLDCPDNSGSGCTSVQSGSSDQYTLLASDHGSLVRVVVSATNGVGADGSANSAFTSAVTQSPANSSLPSITGSATAGQTLTASAGNWSGDPSPTFTYTWQDCPDNSGNGCSQVQSGSSDQYTLLASDEGSFVQVLVSATNGVGSDASAMSPQTSAVTGPPVEHTLPSLTGTATAGQTLNAATGNWSGYPAPTFTYEWQDCPDDSGSGCTTIAGAASNAYVLAATDEGLRVNVIVKASNGIGPGVSAASATTGVINGAAANTSLPSIAGTASAGQTLTASSGGWTGYPAPSLSYTWEDCPDTSGNGCSQVQSGLSDQYTLGSADEGAFVLVIVTASNSAGPDVSASSAPVGQVTGPPSNISPPSISGPSTAGQTLTASPGGWLGYPAPTFTYAWQLCPDNSGNGCSQVQSGASAQYALPTAAEGKLVRVVVMASNGVGTGVSVTTAFTSTVTGAPANTALPSIAGTVSAGQTLTASSGNWSGYPTPTFTYLWQDCPNSSGNGCSQVQSGTSSQYALRASDEGSRVRVTVTATNGVGSNPSAMSAFTSVVSGAPVNGTLPSISGSAQQGQTLSASPGNWTANPAPTYNYQWQDCPDSSGNGCKIVQSGPSSQYTLLSSDEGALVQAIVTATNSVGHASATSALTAAITGPPVIGTPPAVTGTAQMGHTLNASTGSWTGYPAPTFTYTWQDCPDSSGNGCQTISGAASSSYVLAASDEGLTVRVTVKATNGVGSAVSATSATTSVVTGAPQNTVAPSISGTASAGQTLTASAGSWNGYPAPTFTYTWQDCAGNSCSIVQSGANDQYALGVSDEGLTVEVVVTAINGVTPNGPATSAPTSAVTGAPVDTTLPSVAGPAASGQTLTASPGAWFGYPLPTFNYAWQDCQDAGASNCQTVQSGTSNQYALSASDAGLFVRVLVTASNSVGSSGLVASATTAAVTAGPANTQLPSISGTAQQGVALSGSAGTWTGFPTPALSFQWQDCNTQGSGCGPVATGGHSVAYTPTAADVGNTLVLSVTATNGSGSVTVASAPTAPVVIAPPSNTALPAITGTAQQGATLSASNGTWTNSPTSFTYAWLQCDSLGNTCTPIAAATANTYVPVAGDVGATLRVTVTATNALGPGSATSAHTTAIVIAAPANTQLPAISGIAGEGQLLSTSNGVWGNTPTSFGYQWQQCDATGANCSTITTAMASNYVTQPGDVGHTLRVTVTAFNAGGNSAAASAQSAIIGTIPANTAPPAVSGVAQQGQTLTITSGTWSGTPAPTFTYQWEQCDGAGNNCSAITSATAAGYAPISGDVGHTLRAQVIASNTAGSPTATSAATAAILIAAPTDSALPAVSGTPQPGQTLSASTGTWSNTPTGFGYQWSQCDSSGNACAPIATATSASYLAGAGDVGHTLRVSVTATNAGGPGQATSSQSQVVSSAPPLNTAPPVGSGPAQQGQAIAPPSNTALPLISGTAEQGQKLSLSDGTWANSPSSFAYQWLRCDGAGGNCTAIADATGNKYVPVSADGAHTLRATVTASNAGGATAATSIKTVVVGSLQVSVAAPILGQTSNLAPVSGTVLVLLPGSKTFTRLTGAIDLPMGSTIDARSGKVTLTVALPHGATQTGQFYDGEFVLTQASSGMTILTLTGASFAGCPAASTGATTNGATGSAGAATGGASTNGARASAANKKPTTVIRQLWGNAHGDYTTKGRYGSAAVSGTVWLTEDRCDGTYVKVTKDNVIVVAYAHPHTKHNIQQGHHILIPAPVH